LESAQQQSQITSKIATKTIQKYWAKVRSSGSIIEPVFYNVPGRASHAFIEAPQPASSKPRRNLLTKSEVPQVLGIILCERVLQDVLRRTDISCINIHNSIAVQGFPAVVPLLFAFAQVSGSHHEFSYQFKMVDRQEQIIAMSPVAKVEPLPNKFMTHKVISAFSGLVFQEEGTYSVILSLDGQEVGSLPFQVLQVSPESAG
jgi:hypothetical protein